MSQAADRAYDSLRDLIIQGEYEAGEQFREEHLAARLAMSRTPVREAMRRLESEGVLERRENRRSYLSQLDARDMDELFVVRASLESIAAGLAAARAGEELVERLEGLAKGMDDVLLGQPVDYGRLTQLNETFHTALLEAGGNRILAATARGLMRRPLVTQTFRRYSKEQLARSQAHHREIIAACRAGDLAWAESVMRSHVLAAASVYRASSPTATSPEWPTI